MHKKKEYPRKRKRFVRKIIFFSIFLGSIFLLAIGTLFYFFEMKLRKPLYISPMPIIHAIQSNDSAKDNELQKALEKKQIAYTAMSNGDNNSIIVTLQKGGKVTFSSQKDIMSQIASLQYILSHLTMEGRQFSTLDFRFDKPVVVIKP